MVFPTLDVARRVQERGKTFVKHPLRRMPGRVPLLPVWLVTFALLVGACGVEETLALGEVPEEAVTPGAEAQALGETVACSRGLPPATLSEWNSVSDDNRCEGAWEYRENQACANQAACGCQTPATCTNWRNNGTDPVLDVKALSFTMNVETRRVCESLGHCWDEEDWDATQAKCDAKVPPEVQHRKTLITQEQQAHGLAPAGQFLNFVTFVGGSLSLVDSGNGKATCSFKLNVPRPKSATSLAVCGCAVAGSCPNDTCNAQPTSKYSAMGLSLNGLRSAVTDKLLHERDFTPVCTTGEALSSSSNSRYDRLTYYEQHVPPNRTDVLNALRRSMMMLYEFHGASLDSVRRADAKARYQTYNTLIPACGATMAASCASLKTARPDVAAALQRCTRLLSKHVSSSLVTAELQECLEVLTLKVPQAELTSYFNACQPAPGAPHYFDEVQSLYQRLWERQLDIPLPPAGTESESARTLRLEALSRQLWSLDSTEYNSVLLRAADPRLTPAQRKEQDAARLTTLLERWDERWDQRYTLTAPTLSAMNASNATLLVTELAKGRAQAHRASQELILALYTPVTAVWRGSTITSTPTDGDVRSALLGDALTPLAQQLAELATFHDFSCALRDCRSESSPLSQTYRLFAGLRQVPSAGFTEALNGATTDLSGWRPVFAKLAQQGGLSDVQGWMQDSRAASPSPNLDHVPRAARPLVQLILEAHQRHRQYQKEGLFVSNASLLRTGQHAALRDQLSQLMTQKNEHLKERRDRYTADILAFARAQIGQNGDAGNLDRLKKMREQKANEHAFTSADRNGLAASATAADTRLGAITDALTRIEGALNQNQFVDIADSQTFFASAADAKYPGTGTPDLALLGVGPVVQVPAGRFVSVVVDPASRWAPTCALRSASFISPSDGNTKVANVSEALIGPEGYTLQFTDDAYQSRSATDSRTFTGGVTVKGEVCATTGLSGRASGVEAKACVTAHAGVEWSKGVGHTNESSQRASAAFALGLRLKDTPFNQAPVGSLLAVVVDNATNTIADYQVVRTPATTVVAARDSRVVFVVNDRKCNDTGTSQKNDQLRVTVNTVTTVGDVAPRVVDAMSQVLNLQRLRLDTYVGQGRLLPSDMSLLRAEAYQLLTERLAPLGITLETLPQPLTTLFENFVLKEMVGIERAVELQELDRRLILIQLELDAMDFDINAGDHNAKLHELIIDQMIRNMDALYLREKAAELMQRTQDHLLPALRIWYPTHLAAKLGQPADSVFKKALAGLSTTMPVNKPVLDLVNPATQVVSELLLGFIDAPFGNVPAGQDGFYVRVSFPRPRVFVPNPLGSYFGSSSHTVDGLRARLFWDAVDANRLAPITLSPEDIYASLSPQGMLPCNEVTPVIRRIGFYFGTNDGGGYPQADAMNGLGRVLTGYVPRQQSFLTETGEQQHLLAPDSPFQTLTGQVFYGLTGAANTVLTSKVYDPSRPVGLSPFGTFHLDFTRVRNPVNDGGWSDATYGTGLTEAKEFVVVMELDSKRGTQPAGVPICQSLPPPPTRVPTP